MTVWAGQHACLQEHCHACLTAGESLAWGSCGVCLQQSETGMPVQGCLAGQPVAERRAAQRQAGGGRGRPCQQQPQQPQVSSHPALRGRCPAGRWSCECALWPADLTACHGVGWPVLSPGRILRVALCSGRPACLRGPGGRTWACWLQGGQHDQHGLPAAQAPGSSPASRTPQPKVGPESLFMLSSGWSAAASARPSRQRPCALAWCSLRRLRVCCSAGQG